MMLLQFTHFMYIYHLFSIMYWDTPSCADPPCARFLGRFSCPPTTAHEGVWLYRHVIVFIKRTTVGVIVFGKRTTVIMFVKQTTVIVFIKRTTVIVFIKQTNMLSLVIALCCHGYVLSWWRVIMMTCCHWWRDVTVTWCHGDVMSRWRVVHVIARCCNGQWRVYMMPCCRDDVLSWWRDVVIMSCDATVMTWSCNGDVSMVTCCIGHNCFDDILLRWHVVMATCCHSDMFTWWLVVMVTCCYGVVTDSDVFTWWRFVMMQCCRDDLLSLVTWCHGDMLSMS